MASRIHHAFFNSLIIYSQFILVRMSSNTNPYSISSHKGCTGYRIIELLQSSLMNTTNVQMIIDNDRSFTDTIESMDLLKMFSNQKTFSLETYKRRSTDNSIEEQEEETTEDKVYQTPTAERHDSLKRQISRNTESGESPNMEDKRQIDGSPSRSSGGMEKFNLTHSPLSYSTTLVLFLGNLSTISTFEVVFIKNPSIIKIVYIYKGCKDSRVVPEDTMRYIARFAHRLWEDFRVLFLYFILQCPDVDWTNEGVVRKGWHLLHTEINMTFKLRNLFDSVFMYDPFSLRDAPKGNNNTNFGHLKEIKLTKNCSFVSKSLIGKLFSLNGYQLKIAFFANSMAVQRVDVPFMSRHLTQEQLENRFNLLETYFGPEPEVVAELSYRMNFTPLIRLPLDNNAYGYLQDDGIFNGALGDIIYRRADLALNGYFIKDYETRDIEFTATTQDDKLCIVVQTPGLIPDSLLLFKVFSKPVWLLLIGTFIVASLLYTFLLYVVGENNERMLGRKDALPFKSSNETYNRVSAMLSQCTRIIAVLLNAPLSYAFDSSSYERVFVSLCLLWGLNVMGSFQGSLVDVYTTPKPYPSIQTLEELDEKGLPIYVRHWGLTVDIFGSEPPGTPLGNLVQKLILTTEDHLNLRISKDETITGLGRKNQMHQVLSKLDPREDHMPPLKYIRECPRTYTLGNIVPKSSPFLEPINHYSNLFASNGLISKWIKDIKYIFKVQSDLINREFVHDSKTTLNLSHLQLAFFALFLGLFISFIIFCAEVYAESKKNVLYTI